MRPDGTTLITFSPRAAEAELVAYFERLGCSIASDGTGRLRVCVTYPETVENEHDAIRAWCAAWTRAGRGELAVSDTELSARSAVARASWRGS